MKRTFAVFILAATSLANSALADDSVYLFRGKESGFELVCLTLKNQSENCAVTRFTGDEEEAETKEIEPKKAHALLDDLAKKIALHESFKRPAFTGAAIRFKLNVKGVSKAFGIADRDPYLPILMNTEAKFLRWLGL